MYQNPTLFPQVSNRESWDHVIEIADDDTGDPITLTDGGGNALYSITLQIEAPHDGACDTGYGSQSPYVGGVQNIGILATLSDYIAIVDTGVISFAIPRSIMQTLPPRTYDVFLTVASVAADDARQILIGRLPVLYGGRNT